MKKRLKDILEYEQPSKYIVDSQNYSDDYQIPVLTAGKSFILGYTNETEGVFEASKAPVIIFDDFTAASKYVDFDFKVKSSAMKILHLSDPINSLRYVYFAMQKIDYTPFSHKRIWISDYCNFEIELPTSTEQNRIVVELDTIQRAIDLKRKQLNDLDELVKSKFQEMFGDVKSYKCLREYSSLITKGASPRWQGLSYQESGTLFITSENVREGYLDVSKAKYLDDEINELLPRSVLKKGDILINIVGASIGRAAIFDIDQIANINQAVALVRTKKDEINILFLIEYLNTKQAMDLYDSMKQGGARDNLSLKNIADLLIPDIPISKQNDFATVVRKINELKGVVIKEIDDLEELLESKMDEYFGEKKEQ